MRPALFLWRLLGCRANTAAMKLRFPLVAAETRLTIVGEDVGDRLAGASLDHVVEIDEGGIVTMGEPPPDGALAAAWKPDEDDVHQPV